MIIKSAKFITSVADYAKFPETDAPQITIVGRSNVGKSSIINMLAGQHNLARTSSTPGMTRLINLFDFNNGEFLLVDLPGYGFQAGSKEDSRKWGSLMEQYLQYHFGIKLALFLLDIRHKPSEQDVKMLKYLNFLRIPFTIIATKADKIPRSGIKQQIAMLDSHIGVGIDNFVVSSAVGKFGAEQILTKIEQALN